MRVGLARGLDARPKFRNSSHLVAYRDTMKGASKMDETHYFWAILRPSSLFAIASNWNLTKFILEIMVWLPPDS